MQSEVSVMEQVKVTENALSPCGKGERQEPAAAPSEGRCGSTECRVNYFVLSSFPP